MAGVADKKRPLRSRQARTARAEQGRSRGQNGGDRRARLRPKNDVRTAGLEQRKRVAFDRAARSGKRSLHVRRRPSLR